MTTKRQAYLIKIDPRSNNNKFYHMEELATGQIKATWGRIGNKGQTKVYEPWEKTWFSLLDSKTRKGYGDKTSLMVNLNPGGGFNPEASLAVQALMDFLAQASKQQVRANYIIDPNTVSTTQLAEAQDAIAGLRKAKSIYVFNRILTGLYATLPRKMGKVADTLITDMSEAQAKIDEEQELLDSMRTQANLNTAAQANGKTMSESLGLEIRETTDAERAEVKKLLGGNWEIKGYGGQANGTVKKVFRVSKTAHDKRLADYIKARPERQRGTNLLFHGSRNENWLSILETGLVLFPNATRTGSLFGNGLYFADDPDKSLGYSSVKGSRWANGRGNKGILAVFEVHTGFELRMGPDTATPKLQPWIQSLDTKGLKKVRDYDSVSVKVGFDYGGSSSSLRKNEFIVYEEDQVAVRYLLEVEA